MNPPTSPPSPHHLASPRHPPLDETLPSTSSQNILLMLVGLPGSGKTTFCSRLLEHRASQWKRICQDIISNGKQGSKEQCLKAAKSALTQGFNVIIDRCNVSTSQRQDFLDLARSLHVNAHALFLDLPAKVCVHRAYERKDHEGGLRGKGAAVAVQRMAKTTEKPSGEEGFSQIRLCSTDDEIEEALHFYVDFPQVREQNRTDTSFIRTPLLSELEEGSGTHLKAVSHSNDSTRMLAFPSISTSDFQFDHEKAAGVIVETVSSFLQKFKDYGLRLVMVDLKENSDMLNRVRLKAKECGLMAGEFCTIAGDITKLFSSRGLKCTLIANATNWRLNPRGGGVNAAIFKAAGPEFEIETKKRAKILNPGSALVVPLPVTSPLYTHECVTHVIHVLGPNMNPERPNCLHGDYNEGCRLLREAYTCMFEAFVTTAKADSRHSLLSGTTTVDADKTKPLNAFAILMQSAKRKIGNAGNEHKEKHSRCDLDPSNKVGLFGGESQNLDGGKHSKFKKAEPWADELRKMAKDPEHYKGIVIQVTSEAFLIADKYPKGRKHFLVISREEGLDSIRDLKYSHISLLQHMHSMGQAWIQKLLEQDQTLVFRMGYHSEPSMRQLHMHVISQDFDSSALKNKKHWNSFTTAFFRDSKAVIEELESTGTVKPHGDENTLFVMELRCHKCRCVQPNIPKLKQHIRSCESSFPHQLVEKGFLITAKYDQD